MSITSVVLTKEQKSIIAEALEVMPEDLEEIKIKANSYKKTSFRDDFSMIFLSLIHISEPTRPY